MRQRPMVFLLMLIGLTLNAQTINLRGTVSNTTGSPIANAIVTLVGQGIKDTTGSDGAYQIMNGTPAVMPILIPQNQAIFLNRGFLEFSLPEPSAVKVAVFDIQGNLLKKELLPNASTGFYRFAIAEVAPAANVLIVKASIGRNEVTFRYLPLKNRNAATGISTAFPFSKGNTLAKQLVIGDTLKAAAAGYQTKATAITSYDQQLNIVLDTSGGNAIPSAGCGKTKTVPDSQQTTISVNGTSRSYILCIPKDYDQNHPYALWFAIHGMGGDALGVARGSAGTNYSMFGVRKFANKDKGTTIFCAPNGSGGGWGSGASDLEFFRSMIKKFETDLCIDKSRIFASGFSMGGSMSYALACAMPDTFRAVAMHSGGAMSGCDQSHRGPVPMFITHGVKDGRCTWPGLGQPQINDLAARDGCETIDLNSVCKPTDPVGMNPVCVNYQSCDPGYPCRACIFYDANQSPTGAHTPSPGPVKGNDWGEASTWVPESTWNYFKQFY